MGALDILRAASRHMAADAHESVSRSFIGPSARTFDWDRLITAMRAENQGAPRPDIWLGTLTGRMPNGAWAQEVSNAGAATNFEDALRNLSPRTVNWMTLRDVYDDPALYGAYPDFANMRVRILPEGQGEQYASMAINPILAEPDHMTIGRGFAHDRAHPVWSGKRVIIHEADHAAQAIEGFPSGANTDAISADIKAARGRRDDLEWLDTARTYLARGYASSPSEALTLAMVPTRRSNEIPYYAANWDREIAALDADLAAARANPLAASGLTPAAHYRRSAGEALARVSQESADLGDVERALVPPWERMTLLDNDPVGEHELWLKTYAPGRNRRAIRDRAKQDDALGRALADAIRTAAGIGGVTGALSIAANARHGEREAAKWRAMT